MFSYTNTKDLPYSWAFLFQIVQNISAYPEFLPWIVSARVYGQRGDQRAGTCLGDLTIGYGPIQQSYTSRVEHCTDTSDTAHPFIAAHHVKGPFRHLSNRWVFEPLGDGMTRVHVSIAFELDSMLLKTILDPILEKAAHSIMASFEERAKALMANA